MNTSFNKVIGENIKHVFSFTLKPNKLSGQPNRKGRKTVSAGEKTERETLTPKENNPPVHCLALLKAVSYAKTTEPAKNQQPRAPSAWRDQALTCA